MNLFYFLGGLLIGYGFRLVYHTITGRDIPIYKPRYEVERLLGEAELIVKTYKERIKT